MRDLLAVQLEFLESGTPKHFSLLHGKAPKLLMMSSNEQANNAGTNDMQDLLSSDPDSDDDDDHPTDDDLLSTQRINTNIAHHERVMRAHRVQRHAQQQHAMQHDMTQPGVTLMQLQPVIFNNRARFQHTHLFQQWIDRDAPVQPAVEATENTITRIPAELTPPMVIQTAVTSQKRGSVARQSMHNACNNSLRQQVNQLMRKANPTDPRIVGPYYSAAINELDDPAADFE